MPFKKGEIPWNKNRTSIEDKRVKKITKRANIAYTDTRRPLSERVSIVKRLKKRYKIMLGSSLRTNKYGVDWPENKLKAMERDNYKCVRCGTSLDLQVHHKVPFKIKPSNDVSGLMTLCRSCHKIVENEYYNSINNSK